MYIGPTLSALCPIVFHPSSLLRQRQLELTVNLQSDAPGGPSRLSGELPAKLVGTSSFAERCDLAGSIAVPYAIGFSSLIYR
jgi:hypothetical protein